jgi:hypothetical protein
LLMLPGVPMSAMGRAIEVTATTATPATTTTTNPTTTTTAATTTTTTTTTGIAVPCIPAPVKVDLLEVFRVATSGFLKLKFLTNTLTIFKPTYVTYWVSLHGTQFTAYSDETEAHMQHEFTIGEGTSVRVEKVVYENDDLCEIECHVTQDNITQFYFSTRDSAHCENWMIVFIERSKGFFDKKVENFDLGGNDVMDEEADIQSDRNSRLTSCASSDREKILEGYLSRYCPSNIFSKWSLCWIELSDDAVFCWPKDDKDGARDRRRCKEYLSIDGYSRVDVIESTDIGKYLFFIAVKNEDETYTSWRFFSESAASASAWMKGVKDRIAKCQLLDSASAAIALLPTPRAARTNRSTIRALEDSVHDFAVKDFSSPEACPVAYQRDKTLMGSMMLKLRGTYMNREKMRQFYLQRFCHPVYHGFIQEDQAAMGNEDVICVSVFENQRVLPFNGFNCLNLVIGLDPAKLSDMDGVKFPDRYLKMTLPPPGYEWVKDEKNNFRVDLSYWETAEGGWTYATSFSRYAVHKRQRRSLTDINHVKAMTRRRRWIRNAQKISSVEAGFDECGHNTHVLSV